MHPCENRGYAANFATSTLLMETTGCT
ncbi:hypothetical protein TNCV_2123731, partial [Trichonephila clavipes]